MPTADHFAEIPAKWLILPADHFAGIPAKWLFNHFSQIPEKWSVAGDGRLRLTNIATELPANHLSEITDRWLFENVWSLIRRRTCIVVVVIVTRATRCTWPAPRISFG